MTPLFTLDRRVALRATGGCAEKRHRSSRGKIRTTSPRLAAERPGRYAEGHVADPATTRASIEPRVLPRLPALLDELMQVLGPDADLAELDSEQLRQRIALLRRLEGLTTAAMAAAVGALERAGGVREDGASSTTAWVAEATGKSRRQASRTTRLASSLPDMPRTAAALADGRLAPESADIMVAAARDGRLGSPTEVEDELLPVATAGGPEHLRAEVRQRTQEADGAAMVRDENRQRQRRRLSLTRRDDGMWDLYGLLPAELANKTRTMLDAFEQPDPKETPPEQRRRPDQRMADAWEAAVDVTLGLGDVPTTGGVARPHVSVLVDIATFDADLTDPNHPDQPLAPDDPAWSSLSPGQTEWAGALSPQAARKLCCDAGVSRVVMAGPSQVLDVGRETRQWSPAQRRAINARDRCCRGPGCGRPIGWTQIHHLRWWRRHGRTDVDNGLALCSSCHDLIHHLGWHAELDPVTAAVTWTSPDRRRTVVTYPRPPS